MFHILGSKDDVIKQDMAIHGLSLFDHFDIKYVTIHKELPVLSHQTILINMKNLFIQETRQLLSEILSGDNPIYEDNTIVVYEIPKPNSSKPFLLLGSGWHIFEAEYDIRIAMRNSEILIVNPTNDEMNTKLDVTLYSPKNEQQAYLELMNTNVGANSSLDVTTLQMMDQSSINFSTRKSQLAQDSKINWYLGLFGAMLSRYRIDYHLNGTGASANDSEVIFGNNNQSFDLNTVVNHNEQSTEGKVVEKSILKNNSKSLFKGMIKINENAAHSNSFLSGRSILLDKDAKSDAIPGLEILTNDVKATHSASVAQMDEEQIFYMGTRCLSRAESERIIVEGFLEPMSRSMSYQVRAWISYLIESKWEGKELSINNDEQLKSIVEVEETRYNENAEVEQHYKYR